MSTKTEYENFLTWLHARAGVTEDVKRVANTVHTHFDRIERTSSNQGQRSRTLTPLLTNNFSQIASAAPAIAGGPQLAAQTWVRLSQIVVGPFRGFRVQETFDLNKRIVLFYGQNGTGKTSFCEALEYALLGEVEEAGHKRISANDYLRNVHARRFDIPTLSAVNAEGVASRVTSNPDAYRFCFVEKNRIEAFSRMSSRTPAQRTELIAALFGMEGFSEFVRNFNADLTGSLTLTARKGAELATKRQQLAADQNLVNTQVTRSQALTDQETALATQFRAGGNYAYLLAAIGTEAQSGRLQELDGLLAAPTSREIGETLDGIQTKRRLVTEARAALNGLNAELDARRAEVNFKSLYVALQGLEQENLNYCPACTTPLTGDEAVLRNPFQRAREGMAQLSTLGELQRRQTEAQTQLRRDTETLNVALTRLSGMVVENLNTAPLIHLLRMAEVGQQPAWFDTLDVEIDGAVEGRSNTPWLIAKVVATLAQNLDETTRQQNANRVTLLKEQTRLRDFQLRAREITALQTRLAQDIENAETNIQNFNTVNARLITEAETERQTIEAHRPVDAAYLRFLELLRTYRDQLPQALTANLSDTTRDLFNAFNRYDHEGDKLAQLRLPTNDTGRILISFNSHPQDLHDALLILSEGHIRCLGLAILVAKNIQQGCPLLLFDDAVNAIDDEHRLGIRDTLFDSPAFAEKQLVITCHGEEMIKDIENVLGHQQAQADCLSYTFLPHEGDRVIRVVTGQTRNYILEARRALADGRNRAALGHARRATEAVTARTWKFLGNLNQGELRLKMERQRAPIELNDLAAQLKRNIDAVAFQHVRKARLTQGYTDMLVPRAWAVINAGTHEEAGRPEFPPEVIRGVVDNLAMLDEVLSGRYDRENQPV